MLLEAGQDRGEDEGGGCVVVELEVVVVEGEVKFEVDCEVVVLCDGEEEDEDEDEDETEVVVFAVDVDIDEESCAPQNSVGDGLANGLFQIACGPAVRDIDALSGSVTSVDTLVERVGVDHRQIATDVIGPTLD